MDRQEPLFLKNREWYILPEDEGIDGFFPDGRGYHIRQDAPDDAKRSYDEFYDEGACEFPDISELIAYSDQ